MSLGLMKERLLQAGGNLRDETIKDAKYIYSANFKDDPSYSPTMFFLSYDELSGDIETQAHLRIYDKRYSAANGNTEKFQCSMDQKIVVGDCFLDKSDNTYWLCTEVFNVEDIHYKGKLTQCQYELFWQNSDGKIISRYAWVQNASAYNNGESGNNTITLQSNQFMVYLPYDEDTCLLDNGFRMHMSRSNRKCKPYKITRPDDIAYGYGEKGILNLIFTQRRYNPTGDKLVELEDGKYVWICNYISPTPTPDPEPTTKTYTATISCTKKEIASGSYRTFKAVFKDTAGNIVDNLTEKWTIISDFTDKLTITEGTNSIKIAVNNDNLITKSFKLKLEAADDSAEPDEISILITSLY